MFISKLINRRTLIIGSALAVAFALGAVVGDLKPWQYVWQRPPLTPEHACPLQSGRHSSAGIAERSSR